jgi:hypothetical protein
VREGCPRSETNGQSRLLQKVVKIVKNSSKLVKNLLKIITNSLTLVKKGQNWSKID